MRGLCRIELGYNGQDQVRSGFNPPRFINLFDLIGDGVSLSHCGIKIMFMLFVLV